MSDTSRGLTLASLAVLALLCCTSGCQSLTVRGQDPEFEEIEGSMVGGLPLPTEKDKTAFPLYTIEAPDVLKISVEGVDPAAGGPLSGEHIVAPDGTINLGPYGCVFLAGMTLDEGRQAVAAQISSAIENPQVTLEVMSYNSKAYYVIVDRGCFGETIIRMAATGNETVLDAVAQTPGVCHIGHKRVWIARPGPPGTCDRQILPVCWKDVTSNANTSTNYQILPGDRVYIASEGWGTPFRHLLGAHPANHP